jgi:hypothetical protein
MGLDITHDAWHGSYGSFMAWRTKIAELAGFPPLELMEGFYYEDGINNPFTLLEHTFPNDDELQMWGIIHLKKRLPIKWDLLIEHPLYELLRHSDCDGYISYTKCKKIADALEELLPLMLDDVANLWKDKTKAFINGLRLAYNKKQNLKFK